jgi:protein-S-isoprenylcysteine O-methyltransferase Ste14
MEKILRIPPPVIALVLALFTFSLDWLIPIPFAFGVPLLGIVLMAVGMTLGALALVEFRQIKTTPLPLGEPSALVGQGPYLWTRNPMYLGLFTVLLGFAFYLGKLLLFAASVGFYVIIDRLFIPHEENKLKTLFGDAYTRYLTQVQRWL